MGSLVFSLGRHIKERDERKKRSPKAQKAPFEPTISGKQTRLQVCASATRKSSSELEGDMPSRKKCKRRLAWSSPRTGSVLNGLVNLQLILSIGVAIDDAVDEDRRRDSVESPFESGPFLEFSFAGR